MRPLLYENSQILWFSLLSSEDHVPPVILICELLAERAIHGFYVDKKNWQIIDTINGAKTSAIIYSIIEGAKANNLKPFEYVQYLLEKIPKHMDDTDYSFLENLLPWSENLPAEIRTS